MWKGRRTLIRIGTVNIGTMTGRGRELADMMVLKMWIYCAYREQSGKRVKRGTMEVAANCSTTEQMEKNGIGIVFDCFEGF